MLNYQAEPDRELVFRQSSQEGEGLIEGVVLISMEVLFSFSAPGQCDDLTLDHTHHCSLSQAAG